MFKFFKAKTICKAAKTAIEIPGKISARAVQKHFIGFSVTLHTEAKVCGATATRIPRTTVTAAKIIGCKFGFNSFDIFFLQLQYPFSKNKNTAV